MCGKLQGAGSMAQYRFNRLQREQQERQEQQHRAIALGKWLPRVFWLLIAGIAPVTTLVMISQWLPGLKLVTEILILLLAMAEIGIYFLLGKENRRYRVYSLYAFGATVVGFVLYWITGGDNHGWAALINLAATIAKYVGVFHQYVAHSEVLVSADYALSEKWLKLWRWRLISIAVFAGSRLIMFLFPLLGILLFAAAAVPACAIPVFELIYLYRMGGIFRTYAQRLEG